jgi:phosphatidylserine/phosphatidylglycerophosphate/cardiolipin synthase-like enzyme
VKLIRTLPAGSLRSIADGLKVGRLKPPYSAFSVAEWAPQNGRESLAAELHSLSALGFTPAVLALSIDALAESAMARQRAIDQVQLVWTSPDQNGPHVRDTSVVVRQVISQARKSLWISTFNVFDGNEVFQPVYEACACFPELRVTLVLNVPADVKTKTYGEPAVAKYVNSFWKYHWPWDRRPAVFYDPRASEQCLETPACQHAKCILVDDQIAFITSANFTESAHKHNVELGVVFHDNPELAISIRRKIESLINNRFLTQMPGSDGWRVHREP